MKQNKKRVTVSIFHVNIYYGGKIVPNGASNGFKIVTKSNKNALETKSTKHVENVLILTPLDLQKTRFRMEWLSTIIKIRGADKHKKYQTMVSK